jgi:pantoate--beta-alanine ligase
MGTKGDRQGGGAAQHKPEGAALNKPDVVAQSRPGGAGGGTGAVPGRSPVPLVATADEVRERVAEWRDGGQTVALVPTLGNLHEGHLSLARLARKVGDRVVMTIFVNPTQFGPGEDFANYPRTLDEDREKLAEAGTVDLLFVPEETEIYPFGTQGAIRFILPPLSRELCGASRPGHFDGVASVVCRLLGIVAPQSLVLGRKDYQQLVLVEHMITDLRLPVRVVSGATFREADGLALSSRNRYLSEQERARAPRLHAVLEETQHALGAGRTDYAELERQALDRLRDAGFRPDYVAVRRAKDLGEPMPGQPSDALIVLGAAWLGGARLIDNTSR